MNTNDQAIMQALEAGVARRRDRREFIRLAGSSAALAVGGAALAACGGGNSDSEKVDINPPVAVVPTPAPTAIGDPDILNFALNLEYLEAEFYSFAVNGTGLAASLRTGVGVQGTTLAGRKATFTDPVVAQYAAEIAADEIAHVRFLRTALGASAVAAPTVDVSVSPTSAFSNAARSAGLIGAGQSFDPYASDENFLLGAFIFEDVGVTAYKGASPLITSKTFLDAAAGILAAEAYHASLVRTVLFAKGIATPSLRTATVAISDARDSLDGASDLDQGVVGTAEASNIVPTDANALAFSRTTGQVLNIAYLTRTATTSGGFFPQGINGLIQTSAAS